MDSDRRTGPLIRLASARRRAARTNRRAVGLSLRSPGDFRPDPQTLGEVLDTDVPGHLTIMRPGFVGQSAQVVEAMLVLAAPSDQGHSLPIRWG